MSNVTLFDFEGREVRTVAKSGQPWFFLVDVCRVLEIANSRDAASRLDEDEKGTVGNTDGAEINGLAPGAALPTIINESGLYSLVLTSRKPEAKRFKKWITSEVIPAIRKTGGYGHADPVAVLNDPVAMRGLLLTYSEKVIALESSVAVLTPKALALDRIATPSIGSLAITDAAKALQIQPKKLFAWLREKRWIYRRHGSPHYLGYQDKVQAGLVEHKVWTDERPDGTEKIREHVRITARGLARLSEILGSPTLPFAGAGTSAHH